MQVTWQQVVREIDQGLWKPLYLIVGDEPFQTREILELLKKYFVRDPQRDFTRYESFDGETSDEADLLASLEQLPGLFDGDGSRLISCSHFERYNSSFQKFESYFRSPLSTTCFVMVATKVDRRKAWVKAVEERGYTIEVNEPYERDWPKWQGYFARKLKKSIDSDAWTRLVESVGRSLSLVWAELEKLSVYVGERAEIQLGDVEKLILSGGGADIFKFVEEVVQFRPLESLRLYEQLQKNGENDIKLLSLIVRQFRMIENCSRLLASGKTDPKQIAPEIGSHPFFVPKIIAQTKRHNAQSFARIFPLLSECDYELKTGSGNLFQHFLVPYFGV